MMTTAARTGLHIAALGAAATLVLAACSSPPGSGIAGSASDSGSTMVDPTDATALPASGATESGDAVSQACASYFQLDLLNSTYAGGAVADGDMTEAQVRADFHRLLKIMVAQGKTAVADGTADQKLVTNAKRMKGAVNSLAKSQALSDLSKKRQIKFATQSSRVENACLRAGFPLPADNNTARTAAGI